MYCDLTKPRTYRWSRLSTVTSLTHSALGAGTSGRAGISTGSHWSLEVGGNTGGKMVGGLVEEGVEIQKNGKTLGGLAEVGSGNREER